MKVTYIDLKGFKRLHLKKIAELEAEFHAPVTLIVAANGAGKSSTLRELTPLPSVRTDFEKDGRKEIHMEHEGHLYVAISDFSNRVAPHSFKMDGVELNCGHTTDVQAELVAQHFGLTPSIRDLIYNKTEMCSLTRANRKSLFLNINPLDLSLIIPAFKSATSHFKDCKANLQLLYSRKSELESKMIKPEILEQHIKTKQELNEQVLEIDKILYSLEQHIRNLKNQYAADLEYRQQCIDHNQQILPVNYILTECKKIIRASERWSQVPRGDEYTTAYNQLQLHQKELLTQKQDVASLIKTLSQEIDEYQKHLDSSNERPRAKIEDELKTLDEQLTKYKSLPQHPIPGHLLDRYRALIPDLSELLYTFRDSEVKMISPTELRDKLQQELNLTREVDSLGSELTRLNQTIQEEQDELTRHQQKAAIPLDCTSTVCGLRILFNQRYEKVEQAHTEHTTYKVKLEQKYNEKCKELETLTKELQPYKDHQLLTKFGSLYDRLKVDGYLNWRDWDKDLLELVNTQPLKIIQELQELIDGSVLYQEQQQLLAQRQKLVTELEVLSTSAGTSLEFLQSKLKEKESTLELKLKQLDSISEDLDSVDATAALYLEYSSALNKIQDLQVKYQKGERALVVAQAINYWSSLGRKFSEAKSIISEDLRKLETIVQDQQVLRRSYNSETIGLISTIEKDKNIYDLISQALSPNSGFPHKSMVRYLNALINNVNYFLSQIWTYKLKLLPIPEDQVLDYGFRIEVSNELASDINVLSEGQTEIVNLTWILTILLQMKMLNKIPLYADELGRAFDATHRFKLLGFLNQLIDNKYIEQMFLVSHYSVFTTGFTNSEVLCLSPDEMSDLPQGVNEHVKLRYN